ncbi:MAG: hypothetical protein K8T26_09410 [Lentisphaerae bacterium]|nr:hypothetical protein [Lentisphaerota bacterium]
MPVNQEIQDASVPQRLRGASGSVTVEFTAGLLVLWVPFVLAMTEVYRVEHYSRKLLSSAQVTCIRAAAERAGGTARTLSTPMSVDVPILPQTQRVFPDWQPHSLHLERTYYIEAGTEMGGD